MKQIHYIVLNTGKEAIKKIYLNLHVSLEKFCVQSGAVKLTHQTRKWAISLVYCFLEVGYLFLFPSYVSDSLSLTLSLFHKQSIVLKIHKWKT
jgi:hypothetical protein